jgi:hypothetical protein
MCVIKKKTVYDMNTQFFSSIDFKLIKILIKIKIKSTINIIKKNS